MPTVELLFGDKSVEWRAAGTVKVQAAMSPQWELIRALFLQDRVHWIDGFLLFENWREGSVKDSFEEAFGVAASKAAGRLEELTGLDAWQIRRIPSTSFWTLIQTQGLDLDCNIARAVEAVQNSLDQLETQPAKAMALLVEGWRSYPSPRFLASRIARGTPSRAISFLASHAKQKLNTLLMDQENLLLDAFLAVSLLGAAQRNKASRELVSFACIDRMRDWLVELDSIRVARDVLEGRMPRSTTEPEDKQDDLVRLSREFKRHRSLHQAQAHIQNEGLPASIRTLASIQLLRSRCEGSIPRRPKKGDDSIDRQTFDQEFDGTVAYFLLENAWKSWPAALFASRLEQFVVSWVVKGNLRTYAPRADAEVGTPIPEFAKASIEILRRYEGHRPLDDRIARLCGTFGLNAQEVLPDELPSLPPERRDNDSKKNRNRRRTRRRNVAIDSYQQALFHPVLARHRIFGGRRREIRCIIDAIDSRSSGYVLVTGPSGIGKSALLKHLMDRLPRRGRSIAVHFISRLIHGASEKFFLTNVLAQIQSVTGADNPTSHLEWDLRRQLCEALSDGLPEKTELILIIDGVDEATPQWQIDHSILPTRLPDGIHVILSARTGVETDWRETLGVPVSDNAIVTLGRLHIEDILECVRQIPNPPADKKVRRFAAERLYDLSEGDPFYLADLLLALEQAGGDIGKLKDYPIGANQYLRQWWRDASSIATVHDINTFADLMGTFAVAKGPITREVMLDLSSKDTLRGVSYDSLIQSARRYLAGCDVEGFQLAHPRIAEFVQNEMSDEIHVYRDRFADLALRWRDHDLSKGARLYALTYGLHHLLAEKRFSDLQRILTPQWFSTKMECFGYSSALIKDMDLVCDAIIFEGDGEESLTNLFQLIHLKQRFGTPHRCRLQGVEQWIRARMGQIERARNEVESSGDVDDLLIALTGIAQWHASSGREVPVDLLREIETNAGKCQAETQEWAALQLVSIDADLSIRLATRIQNAEVLSDLYGLESATLERCIFRLFQLLASTDPQGATDRAETLACDAYRFLAEVAIAETLLLHDVEISVHHLSIAIGLLKDGPHAAITVDALVAYLFERIQSLEVTRFVPALDALNRISPFYGVPNEPIDLLDVRIAEDPEVWYKAAQTLPPGYTRDSIHLRLFLRHEFSRDVVSDLSTDFCRILAGLEEPAVESKPPDSESQDSSMRDEPVTIGRDPQLTEKAFVVESPPPKPPEERIEQMMEDTSQFPPSIRFYILLEHFGQALTLSAEAQKTYILRVILALYETPQLSRMAAMEAFGRSLLRVQNSSECTVAVFFDRLARHDLGYRGGLTLFIAFVNNLSDEDAYRLADHLLYNSRANSPDAHADKSSTSRLVRAVVAARLAERLGLEGERRSQRLLEYAGYEVRQVSEDKDKADAQREVINSAFRTHPAWVFIAFPERTLHAQDYCWAANLALMSIGFSRNELLERAVRLASMMSFSQGPDWTITGRKESNSIPALQQCLQRLNAASFVRIEQARMNVSHGIDGFCDRYLDRVCTNEHDECQLGDVGAWMGRIDPRAFRRLIENPKFGYGVAHVLNESVSFAAISKDDAPLDELLGTVQLLRSLGEYRGFTGQEQDLSALIRLAALSACWCPDLCVAIVSELPKGIGPGFAKELAYFVPAERWSEGDIRRLLGTLSQCEFDEQVVAQAEVCGWLARRFDVSRELVVACTTSALNCASPMPVFEAGCALLSCAFEESSQLVGRAIKMALDAKDECVFSMLRTLGNAVQSNADSCDKDTSSPFAMLNNRQKAYLRDSVQRLITPEHLSELIRAYPDGNLLVQQDNTQHVAACLAPNHEALQEWIRWCDGLPGLSDETKAEFLGTIAKNAVSARHIISVESVMSIPFVVERTEALLSLADAGSLDVNSTTTWAADSARQCDDPAQRWRVFFLLGDWCADRDIERAFPFWHSVIEELFLPESRPDFAFAIGKLARSCINYPGHAAYVLADRLEKEVYKHEFSYQPPMLNLPKAIALLGSALAYWSLDRKRCKEMIRRAFPAWEAVAKGAESFGMGLLANVCRDRIKTGDRSGAQELIETVLMAAPEEMRCAFADAAICTYGGVPPGIQPFVRFGIYEKTIDPVVEPLIKYAITFASPSIVAYGHTLLAIHAIGKSPTDAASHIEAAVRWAPRVERVPSTFFWRSLWTTYAIVHGRMGCYRAIKELFKSPDLDDMNLIGLLTVAVESIDDKERLLRAVWQAFRTTRRVDAA